MMDFIARLMVKDVSLRPQRKQVIPCQGLERRARTSRSHGRLQLSAVPLLTATLVSVTMGQPLCGPDRQELLEHDAAGVGSHLPYIPVPASLPQEVRFGFTESEPKVWKMLSPIPEVALSFSPLAPNSTASVFQFMNHSVGSADYGSSFPIYGNGPDDVNLDRRFGFRFGANLLTTLSIGDFLPRGTSLSESPVCLVPPGEGHSPTGWNGLQRPMLEGQVDLITGLPLAQFTDLELPFDGATFRLTRTRSYKGDDAHTNLVRADSEDEWWDWVGNGWMASENPILLIDSALPDSVGDNPRTTRLVLDAHHSIPFQLIESDGRYEAPPRFRATLTHNGEWNQVDRSWYWPATHSGQVTPSSTGPGWKWCPPTKFVVSLYEGAVTYTFSPVYDEMPKNRWVGQAYAENGTLPTDPTVPNHPVPEDSTFIDPEANNLRRPLTFNDRPLLPDHYASSTDNNLLHHEPRSFSNPDRNPGHGMPYFALCTRVEGRGGHRVEIQYANVRWKAVDSSLSPDCIEWWHDAPGKGQIKSIKLQKRRGTDYVTAWTLLYTHRRLTSFEDRTVSLPIPDLGVTEYLLEVCPEVDPERFEARGHNAIDRIYVYADDPDTAEINEAETAADSSTAVLENVHFTDTSTWNQDFVSADPRNEPLEAVRWTHQIRYHYDFWNAEERNVVLGNGEPSFGSELLNRAKPRPLLIASSTASRDPQDSASVRVRRHVFHYDRPLGSTQETQPMPWLAAIFYPDDVERALRNPWSASEDSELEPLPLCFTNGVEATAEVTLEALTKPRCLATTEFQYAFGASETDILRQHASVQFEQGTREWWPRNHPSAHYPSERVLLEGNSPYLRVQPEWCIKDAGTQAAANVSLRTSDGSHKHYRISRILYVDHAVELGGHPADTESKLNREFAYNARSAPMESRWFIPYQWRSYRYPPDSEAPACTGLPDLNRPRYISIIDEFESRAALLNCVGALYDTAHGCRAGQVGRRVVEVNASGVILRDWTWQFTPEGTVASGGGLGEEYRYESTYDYFRQFAGTTPPLRTPWVEPGTIPEPGELRDFTIANAEPLNLRESMQDLLLVQKRSVGWSAAAASQQAAEGLVHFFEYGVYPGVPYQGVCAFPLVAEGIRRGSGGASGNEGEKLYTRQIARSPMDRETVTHEVRFLTPVTTLPPPPTATGPSVSQAPDASKAVTYFHTEYETVPGGGKRAKWRRVIGPPRKLSPTSAWYYPIEREDYDTSGTMKWSATGLVANPLAPMDADSSGFGSLILTYYHRDSSGRPSVTILDAVVGSNPLPQAHHGLANATAISTGDHPANWNRYGAGTAEMIATTYGYDDFGPNDVLVGQSKRWSRRWVVHRPCREPGPGCVPKPEDTWVEEFIYSSIAPAGAEFTTQSPLERKLYKSQSLGGATYLVERGARESEDASFAIELSSHSPKLIDAPGPSENVSALEFVPFAQVRMALDANGRPRNAELLEPDSTGAMAAVGSKEINELVDVRREREIDGNIARTTRNLIGQHMRTYVGTGDWSWSGDQALTWLDANDVPQYGTLDDGNVRPFVANPLDSLPDESHNMVITERLEYGYGVNDAWLPTVHRRYASHNRAWADKFYEVPSVDLDGYATVTSYDWRMRPVRVDAYSKGDWQLDPQEPGAAERLTTTLTFLDHADRPVLVVSFGGGNLDLSEMLDPVKRPTGPPPTAAEFYQTGELGVLPTSIIEYHYGPDSSANEIRTYDLEWTFNASQTPPYQSEFHYFGRGGKETFSQTPGGRATITVLDALGRNRSVASVAVGASGTANPYLYELTRTDFGYDENGNVEEELRFERLAPTGDQLAVGANANSVRSRTWHWYDTEKRRVATAECGSDSGAGGAGAYRTCVASAGVVPDHPIIGSLAGWAAALTDGVVTAADIPTPLATLAGSRLYFYTFDKKGNPVCTIDPSGAISQNVYDSRNRLALRIENSTGSTNLPLASTDPAERDLAGVKRVTGTNYQFGRVTELATPSWGPFGGEGALQKELRHRVVYGAEIVDEGFSVVSRNNALVGHVYQGDSGQLPLKFTLRYNFAGQIAERTDARGVVFRYRYDALQRLSRIEVGQHGPGGFSAGPPDALNLLNGDRPANLIVRVAYDYNLRGQLASVAAYHKGDEEEPPVLVTYTYDLRGNLLTEQQAHSVVPVPGDYTIAYDWEYQPTNTNSAQLATGYTRLNAMIYPEQLSHPAREIRIDYDDASDPLSELLSRPANYSTNQLLNPELAGFGYSGSGRRTRLTLAGGGIVQNLDTDPMNLGLEGLDDFGQTIHYRFAAGSNNSSLYDAKHRYDIIGNRTATQLLHDQNSSTLHHYNKLGQLVGTDIGSVTLGSNSGTVSNPSRRDTWRLDAVGNWNGSDSRAQFPASANNWGRSIYGLNGVLQERFTDFQNQDSALLTRTHFNASGQTTATDDFTYDANGNLTSDGTYTYSYDAWNRLLQVNQQRPLEPNGLPVLGPLVKHFSYDGVGRLVRTLSPYPAPSETNNILRSEHFYYDGVRRIQEVVGHPVLSLEGLTESQVYELSMLAWREFGTGEQPDIKSTSTELEQKVIDLFGSGQTSSYLAREYVWGPGDGPAGVDELLVQFDRARDPWWIIQDLSGDVVAMCDFTTPFVNGMPTARVCGRWRYDAYGQCLHAAVETGTPVLHAGHKGLFIDRLDEGLVNPYSGEALPRIVQGSVGLYQNRNRTYSPRLGRFVQADPNVAGQTVLGVSFNGQVPVTGTLELNLQSRVSDSLNLTEYCTSSPCVNSDPQGLFIDRFDVAALGFAFLRGGVEEMVNQYGANLDADVEWAGDFQMGDDWHTRTENSWVARSYARGRHRAVMEELESWLGEPIDAESLIMGVASTTKRTSKVARKIKSWTELTRYEVFPTYSSAKASPQKLPGEHSHHLVELQSTRHLKLQGDGPAVNIDRTFHLSDVRKRFNEGYAQYCRGGPSRATRQELCNVVDYVYQDVPKMRNAARKYIMGN